MGNLSNSSSDQSGHRTMGDGVGGATTNGQYSPIHRELGAILKEHLFNILYHWSPIIPTIITRTITTATQLY